MSYSCRIVTTQQKQSIARAFALGLMLTPHTFTAPHCGPAIARLDRSFNADGFFPGFPGTAEIEGHGLLPFFSIAGGVSSSPDGTIVLGGIALDINNG